jgi:Putative Ig domain
LTLHKTFGMEDRFSAVAVLARMCLTPGRGGPKQDGSKGDRKTSEVRVQAFRRLPRSASLRSPGGFGQSPVLALIVVSAVLLFLSGCKSTGGAAIAVQITPGSSSVDQGQSLAFLATLSNDLRNQGVTWSLSASNCTGITGAGTSGCGKLSNVTTSTVTYTAPTGLTSTLSVTLTATSIANTNSTKTATITVELPLMFTILNTVCGSSTTQIPCGSNGVPYSTTIPVTGGVAPLNFSLVSGSLPVGLQLNVSGAITGRPTGPVSGQPNPNVFTVKVTDDSTSPVSATQQYSIYISPAQTLKITAVSPLQTGFVNYPYDSAIPSSGGVTPFTWSLVSGQLPLGLNLNTSTGQISGVPACPIGGCSSTAPPTSYSFTVQVTDSTLPTSQVAQAPLVITIQQPAGLSITPSSLPAGETASPYSASLSASGGIPPYTWEITSGQLPPGLNFDPASGAITGTPILAVTSSPFTVEVSDSEVTPATLSASYSISIAAGTNSDSLITGEYSFLFQGFDSDGAVAMGGSLLTNGSGKITGGALDMNRASGVIGSVNGTGITRASLSGTYTVGTDGRGTMELVATNSLMVTLTLDFDFALDSNGNVHFFEDNSTTTNTDTKKTHGVGIMKPAPGSFAAASFNGNYAFLFIGADLAGSPTALGGVIHADGVGNIGTGGGGGNGDYNEAGTFSPQIEVSGTFSFDTGTHGDATLTFELPGKSPYTLTYSIDFISPSDIVFVGVDPTDATHPRLSGEMILQSPSTVFDSTALSSPSVATGTGVSNSNATVFAGLLAPAPAGTSGCTPGIANCVTLAYDENNAGTIDSSSEIGFYQISANGRVAFTFTGVSSPRLAVAYLIGPGEGFTIGADSAITTGLLEQQETGVTFSASSVEGNYAISTAIPAENQVNNLLGEVFASFVNGLGSITGTVDAILPPPTSSLTSSVTAAIDNSLTATYSNISATTGRGTITTNSPPGYATNLVFYIVSPGSLRAISTDGGSQHPEVILFDH